MKLLLKEASMKAVHAVTPSSMDQNLSPALFGKMIMLVIAEKRGRSTLPSNEDLTKILLRQSEHMPEPVRQVLHVTDRGTGPAIQEMSEYLFSAQRAGIIERINPTYSIGRVCIGSIDANVLLEKYEEDYPSVVDWLRDILK